jgi:hypothetical protein
MFSLFYLETTPSLSCRIALHRFVSQTRLLRGYPIDCGSLKRERISSFVCDTTDFAPWVYSLGKMHILAYTSDFV